MRTFEKEVITSHYHPVSKLNLEIPTTYKVTYKIENGHPDVVSIAINGRPYTAWWLPETALAIVGDYVYEDMAKQQETTVTKAFNQFKQSA